MTNRLTGKAITLTLSLSSMLFSSMAVANELVTNGSFENYTLTDKSKTNNGRTKWVELIGWQGYAEIWENGAGRTATDGSYKIDLDINKSNVDALSQSITTQSGYQYRLSLDAYARAKHIANSQIEVVLDGQLIATFSPAEKWQSYETTFYGAGGAQTLTLREVAAQNTAYGALIDNVSLQATGETNVDSAINSGDVSGVTEQVLLDAAIAEIATQKVTPVLFNDVYGSDPINFTPAKSSQIFNISVNNANTIPLLSGSKGKVLAISGAIGNARYAAFGHSPFNLFAAGSSTSYEAPFGRLLSWLLAGSPVDNSALQTNYKVALTSSSSSSRTNAKNWLTAQAPNWEIVECDTVATLNTCYNGADLVITNGGASGDAALSKQALSAYMNNGKPVLYVHTAGWGSNAATAAVGELMGFSLPYGGNWWAQDSASWTNADEMQASIWSQLGLGSVETMLNHFKAEDYAFNWSACDEEDCRTVAGLDSDFLRGAEKVKSIMNGLDSAKVNIFANDGQRLYRLLALLGDKFRQTVQYPMDKNSTNDTAFMKSYYADHAVYNYRTINPVQPDMGNFSRSDFSHITPTTKSVNMESKVSFRSAGVYALPGQTVKITRTDSSDLETNIFINTLRSGATHQFAENGYKRPKYLRSVAFPIAAGETISLTSPYGGPIQVEFDTNDLPVSFTFQNVGEHPYWNGAEDNATFTQQLADGHYDWAELVTPGFEIHSKLDKMRESMNDTRWGSADALATATMRYMHNFPHVLAGFQGPGIDEVAELHDFADANGWTIETLDQVKHMNADQASCGYGCSGNPYDAYWAYNPTGHGDVHELGHGLQGGRRFNGWESHSMTNYYSYYTKSQYFKDTGSEPDCQRLPFERMFNVLNASINENDPAAYVKANLWDDMGWSEGAGMFVQMMMAVQKEGILIDGWLLRARLHILEREYNRAREDETTWNAKRNNLGFSQYSLDDTNDIDNNDWLLIALSYVTGRDFSDYLDMWAIPYSTTAKAQVTALEYPLMPAQYFKSESKAYCKGLDKPVLVVDGAQSW